MRTIAMNCLPGSVKKRNLKMISFITTVCFLGLLFISTSVIGQITDPFVQCTNGCTANDIQIKRAYLVDPTTYNELSSSFQCQGNANVKLALDLTTKTPRVGVYVFARIVNHTTHATVYATVGECFSTPLATGGTTKVVFNQSISWPCGTQIDLIDVFIGWGTGNTDFCAGSSDPRCPATPSKCYSLPPGQYISIQIPTATNAIMTQCETTVGGGTSSFDLTSKNGEVSNNASGVSVNWWATYSSGVLSNFISTPSAYVSGSKDVYAKIKNNADTTAFSVATVGLTVVSRPAVYSLSGNSICASAPNTGVITLSNSQTGVSYQLKKASDNSNVQSAKNGTTGSSLQWTGLPAGVSYYVTATGATPTSCTSQTGNASVSETANPGAPSVTYNPPGCDESTFSISVTGLQTGDILTVLDKDGAAIATLSPASPYTVLAADGSSKTFTGIPAGKGYQVTLTRGGCTSLAQSCGTSSNAVVKRESVEQYVIVAPEPTVKAYPNPFNDRVKFIINSAIAGNGALEIYNLMGQKIKTVYQGRINAGNQSFELTIPKKQLETLIYVLRVDGKKVTGKLLQLNN